LIKLCLLLSVLIGTLFGVGWLIWGPYSATVQVLVETFKFGI